MPGPRLNAAAATHIGKVRERNEDTCGVHEAARIAFVADGVGGHPAGDIASRLTADTLAEFAAAGRDIRSGLVGSIQQRMRAHVNAHAKHAGLGTTLDAIQLHDDYSLAIVHIGDSRIYSFMDGALTPLTPDHSYVGDLVRAGALSRENARVHPLSNLITRYIGADSRHEPDIFTIQVAAGTRLLLATDGLTDMVPEQELEKIIASTAKVEELADHLVQAALAAGGRDNISLVVADVI